MAPNISLAEKVWGDMLAITDARRRLLSLFLINWLVSTQHQ
jgi:hypothetical protein